MYQHDLKIWPEYFEAVKRAEKLFQFRRDDREPRFEVGDILTLREWDEANCEGFEDQGYTGRRLRVSVSYILRPAENSPVPIPDGYCVMAIKPWSGQPWSVNDSPGAMA